MNVNELIDRYVHEVGRRLSGKQKEDIQQELRSLLMDQIEERSGGQPALPVAVKVLKEFGEPAALAAQYQSDRYIIGPRLFPIWRQVMSVVLIVLTVLHGVLLATVLISQGGSDLLSATWEWLTTYVSSLLTTFGIVVLIFMGIERSVGSEIDSELDNGSEWDPLTLPPVDDPQRASRGDLIAEIAGSIIASAIFLAMIGENGILSDLLTDPFQTQVPWLIASVGVDIMLKVIVLWRGRWNRTTRWLEIGAEAFGLYVLLRVLNAGSIVTIPFVDTLARISVAIAGVAVTITLLVKIVRRLLADFSGNGGDGLSSLLTGRR